MSNDLSTLHIGFRVGGKIWREVRAEQEGCGRGAQGTREAGDHLERKNQSTEGREQSLGPDNSITPTRLYEPGKPSENDRTNQRTEGRSDGRRNERESELATVFFVRDCLVFRWVAIQCKQHSQAICTQRSSQRLRCAELITD